jgi:hypothetical protein
MTPKSGRIYTAIAGILLNIALNSLRGANNGAEFEPSTCKSTRRGAKSVVMRAIYFFICLETALYFHQVIHSLRDRQTVVEGVGLHFVCVF